MPWTGLTSAGLALGWDVLCTYVPDSNNEHVYLRKDPH